MASDIIIPKVTINLSDAHELSLTMMELLESEDIPVEMAQVAAAMTFGRVVSPRVMSEKEEVAFLEGLLGYVMLYFVEGEPN